MDETIRKPENEVMKRVNHLNKTISAICNGVYNLYMFFVWVNVRYLLWSLNECPDAVSDESSDGLKVWWCWSSSSSSGFGSDGLVWVFQKLLIYWNFHVQPSLGFTENGTKKRKYPVSGSCVDENALLMSEVRGEWVDWLEIIERQQ